MRIAEQVHLLRCLINGHETLYVLEVLLLMPKQ